MRRDRAGSSRRVAAAALLALVLVLAGGCGGKSDKQANEAYANSVCGAISAWEQQLTTIATTFTGSLSKATLQTKVAQAEHATRTLAGQLRAIPPPDTSDGQAAKQQLDQLSTDATATVDAARSAVDQIQSDASATAVATAVLALAPQVKDLAGTARSAIGALEAAGGSLASAFKRADSCKSLR